MAILGNKMLKWERGNSGKPCFGFAEPLAFIAVIALVISVAGCGSSGPPKPDGFPDLVSCTVTIMQEGQALAGAEVLLVPSDGAKDWIFRGTTDGSGNAKITTYGQADGAPKGKYKVVVTKIETDPSKLTPPADEHDSAAWATYERNTMNERLNSYSLVESVYTDAKTTTLELEITGRTTETLDAGKKVRELKN